MCDYVVLPLLNSSFEPGRAREVVEGFVDVDLRNIARAELFYFTGQADIFSVAVTQAAATVCTHPQWEPWQ